jgi:hypothetical protein
MLRLVFALALIFSFSANASTPIEWQKLLHYEKTKNKFTSLVENNEYFLTPNGRHSPLDELNASITAFNQPNNNQKCDFPARFIYLKRKGLVTGNLDNCTEYQQFLTDLQAKSVTMLFTNAYMSNPSSLFGHTLFRIDTKRKGSQLLAHGANFGANTENDTGVLYALKGVYGKYFGAFTIKPYYDVINLYNNIENRDIWEYELNLNNDELELFLALIWEQKKAQIRYYFFTKNCSYILLSILQATKPNLDLTNKFQFTVVPLSTLKAINNTNGLIKNTHYRPSRQSKLNHRLSQMTSAQKKSLYNIIKKDNIDLEKLQDSQKSDVLETAYQYIQYQYIEGNLELKPYRQKSFNLLKHRSQIKDNNLYFEELKTGENPIFSHNEHGASILFGSKNGTSFQEISLKPAYTDLLEHSYGLLKGAEINLLETKLRHYDAKNQYTLNELNILSIKSLSGSNIMFHPISYDIHFGLKEVFNPKTTKDTLALQLETGAGEAYNLTPNTLIYAMTIPNISYAGGLDENGYIGIALKIGLYYNSDNFRLHSYAQKNYTTSSQTKGETYSIEASYSLNKNLNLYTKHQIFNSSYHDDKETTFGLKINF